MRSLRYVPLTFVCGADGFAFFAPYLILFLAISHYVTRFASATHVRAMRAS